MHKELLRPFIIVFILVLIFWNWNSISWIFSYRVLSESVMSFLQKIPPVTQEYAVDNETNKVQATEKTADVVEGNSIEIPKIGITAPLVFINSVEEAHSALDRGVVHYPTSVLPGANGQTIILGHSAPEGWPKIKYDWVFSHLNNLVEGDEFSIYYQGKKLTYSVVKKVFLERGEEIPENGLTKENNVVILISCWPPGKDLRRIAVEATLR